MAHINRRFIDKHWLVFLIRGTLAGIFGCIALFAQMGEGIQDIVLVRQIITIISVFLLFMGIVDSVSALYASTRKHGWFNSVIDAVIDIAASLTLLFWAKDSLSASVIVLSVYTIASGIIDVFHGFLSTVDPTDRFIRILAGALGCVLGTVILNSGGLERSTFIRFFGAYMLIVGVTSLIYGAHNRAQNTEDKIARKQARKKIGSKKKK